MRRVFLRDPAVQWDVIDEFDMFADALHNSFHLPFAVSDTGAVPEAFRARVREQRLGNMCLVDGVMPPHHGVRASRQVKATPRDIVGLQYVLSGQEFIRQGDDVLALGAGDLMVFDTEVKGTYEITQRVRKQTLILPRALAAAALPGVHTPSRVRVIARKTSASVGPLFAVLLTLSDSLSVLSPEATTKAITLVVQMLTDLDLGEQSGRRVLGRRGAGELCERALEYIEENLGDRMLSPASVAAAHFVSVRTLYQAFAQRNVPLATHIRTRRLARCYTDLLACDEPIGEVAARWGFVSLAHFSRSFAKQYGFPPSQLRHQA
jgi:AraC-like DNA-binding protein